jgi:hypothetical protein
VKVDGSEKRSRTIPRVGAIGATLPAPACVWSVWFSRWTFFEAAAGRGTPFTTATPREFFDEIVEPVHRRGD